MRWILGLLVAFVSVQLVRAADVDALYRALEQSDTATVERFVTDHYRDAGISVNDTLTWENQAFDQIVNWYNQYTEVIMLSELPKPAEVAPYWDNWSAVLTQGRWDWRAFLRTRPKRRCWPTSTSFSLPRTNMAMLSPTATTPSTKRATTTPSTAANTSPIVSLPPCLRKWPRLMPGLLPCSTAIAP